MTEVAVTVFGADRPGIVAEVAEVIATVGGNLADSSMTLLRGHFAMMLIADVPDRQTVGADFAQLAATSGLSISVADTEPAPLNETLAVPALMSVHGADRPGIVATCARTLAAHGGNITDVSTRLGHDLYVLIAEVSFPAGTDLVDVRGDLARQAEQLQISVTLADATEDLL